MFKPLLAFVLIAGAALAAPPAPPAGGPPAPMAYDTIKERTLEGTVSSVEIGTRGPGRMVTLVFQAESISWKVMAGPEEVAQRQGFSFAIGDSLTILGVPVTGPEGQMFLARQITRDGTTLTLLDAQGRPAGPGPRS